MMRNCPVKTAVIPVAGMGTRSLPASKAVAKELFPLGFKPIIGHIVDECVAVGIDHIILVTSPIKTSVADYFQPNPELVAQLRHQGKDGAAQTVEDIPPKGVKLSTVIQDSPLGLGHAILCAQEAVAGAPFFVILPDVFTYGVPCLQHMQDTYQAGENSIALEPVADDQISSYGIVAIADNTITAMVEKPTLAEAPSNLAILGRYVLQPEIFDHLRTLKQGAGGEYQLTDAMALLMQQQIFRPNIYKGQVLDCSTPLGFLEANILTLLDDKNTANPTRDILNKYIK